MPRRKTLDEQHADLAFPAHGLDVSTGFWRQPRGTCADALNVRLFEPGTDRGRGGSRPGLSRYLDARVNGANPVQELSAFVGVGYSDPGAGVQTNSSGRVVNLVAVSAGQVFVTSPGATSWTAAVNGTGAATPLAATGVVRSAANGGKLYFADGTNYRYYDPATNRVENWTASQGSLPIHGANTPRLVCTWRGRTVLSGITTDPHNWFMSKVSDPRDWLYFPTDPSPAQAVSGNNSPLGLIGDVVTALIPYSDDVLVVGGDHTVYQFSGDPMAGGQISLVSDITGMAWGSPWCKGPDGTLYFFSNRTGVYRIRPGQLPERISQPVDNLLAEVDTGLNTIRMFWSERYQGMHVFVTATAGAADEPARHFFWEERTGAWWPDRLGHADFDPLCGCVFDGNEASDRVTLIGSWDGYVRAVDPDAATDDGRKFTSSVTIGPLLTANLDDLLLKHVQGVLGADSGAVDYEVYVGATPEQALASEPVISGTWSYTAANGGRNLTSRVRRSGHAVYVKLTSTNRWTLEAIRVAVAGKGSVRRRGW